MPVSFKNNRIASYIRVGLTRMKESKNDWFRSDFETKGCALGLAIAGRCGTVAGHRLFTEGLNRHRADPLKAVAEILEIKPALASEINRLHMQQHIPALAIAERLEYGDGKDDLDDFKEAV